MATDIFGRMLFSDGEGIDPTDYTAIGARALAQLFDQVVAAALPREAFTSTLDAAFDPTASPYAFAVATSGARPRQGTANNKVQIAPGTLLQAIAAADGSEPKLLAYTFPGTDEVTIANGDPTNPRVDLVQMKLEYVEDTLVTHDFEDATTRAHSTQSFNKRRRVKCTLSVKQGTAAASPTYPAPDAGNVVIAGIVVGAAYTGASALVFEDTAGAVAVLHDQRMPLRVRPHGVHPTSFVYPDGGDYVLHNHYYVSRDATGGANDIHLPCTRWGNTGRLVEVDCAFKDPSTLTSRISRWHYQTGSSVDLAHANMNGSGANLASLRRGNPLQFHTGHLPSAGPTVQANANGMGPPIWTNGYRAPAPAGTGEHDTSAPILDSTVAIRYVNAALNSQFGRATFYIADGL